MWNKLRIPLIVLVSASLGAGAVLLLDKSKSRTNIVPRPENQAQDDFDAIVKNQEKLFKNFDTMFDDNFFRHDDPFEEMRKFRDRLGKQFRHNDNSFFSSPFDSWYENKIGGGSVEEISKREDDKYLYYDIKLPGIEGSSIKTTAENGYLTITGEVKHSQNADKEGNIHSYYQSSFRRTFPLPTNVIAEKMEMVSEKDKLILKFPKRVGR